MNIYRGCCHGCLYCDSRSACYQNPDFDTVKAKADALRILRDDLARKVRPAFIATGAMSDPYNPFEASLQLTRHALELIDAYQCGAAIATKSDLIVRDRDILDSIARHSPVICKLTITTTDDALAARLGPGRPPRRLAALRELADRGLFARVLLMPVLPFLEDTEENVLEVVERAAEAGASFVYPAPRRDHAGGPAGGISYRGWRTPSPGRAAGPLPPEVRGPVLVRQPQGQTAVGGVLSQVRSVGHAVPYGADRLRNPGLWGPAAELFLTENTEKAGQMKYTAVVLSVADVKAARGFYEDLFGLEVCQDYGINVSFTCGLSLQQEFDWLVGLQKERIGKKSNNMGFALRRRTWTIFWSS